MLLKPKEPLQYRHSQRNLPKEKVWQVLVHWRGFPKDEATWEDYDDIVSKFPEFFLVGKSMLEARGIDEDHIRRSERQRHARLGSRPESQVTQVATLCAQELVETHATKCRIEAEAHAT
ncbi:hypothetical protein ACOSQ3_019648 [Xanthoceras sorbifolium]